MYYVVYLTSPIIVVVSTNRIRYVFFKVIIVLYDTHLSMTIGHGQTVDFKRAMLFKRQRRVGSI